MTQYQLYCTGLACPLPIVQVSKKIKEMAIGDTLEVTADDLGFKQDIEAWIEKTNHSLESLEKTDEGYRVVIRKTSE